MAPVILPRLEDDEPAERETGEIPLIPADDEPGMAHGDEELALSETNVEKRRFDGDGVGGGRVGGAASSSSFSRPSAGGSSLVVGASPNSPVALSIRNVRPTSPDSTVCAC